MLNSYGIEVKADVVMAEMERKLGILGTSMPQSLLNAVFYCNGKSFALIGDSYVLTVATFT